MQTLLQDVRLALRQLLKSPGFAAVAVLTLGLGVGANTAIFSLVDHVMLRLLPVRKPEELIILPGNLSYPRYQRLRLLGLVLKNGLLLTLLGVIAGLSGAAAVTRLIKGQLHGISAIDPLTFVVAPPAWIL